MYWGNCVESIIIFRREGHPTARKEHECCECGETIKIGDKYWYFVGCWNDGYHDDYDNYFGAYKTCSQCEKDWDKIIAAHHENGEIEACHIFGLLREAVQEAFDEGFLTENDQLVQEWLGIFPIEIQGKQEALLQMKLYSEPLL